MEEIGKEEVEVELDAKLLKFFRKEAQKQNISLSDVINKALREEMERDGLM